MVINTVYLAICGLLKITLRTTSVSPVGILEALIWKN